MRVAVTSPRGLLVAQRAKHAGPGAAVTIRLSETETRVSFRVDDAGAGFDPGVVERGAPDSSTSLIAWRRSE